jgi:hypothetical protein
MKGENCVTSLLILGVSISSIGCFQELNVSVEELFTVLSLFSYTFSLNSITIFLCHGCANPGRLVAVAANFFTVAPYILTPQYGTCFALPFWRLDFY